MEGVTRGLPVRVVDEAHVWDRLRGRSIVETSLPLYQLSWREFGVDGTYTSRVSSSVWLDFSVQPGSVDASSGIISYFHSLPLDWYKNPYLYIYVISVSDVDAYREKQRMRVHVFAEACREKKVEFLIIYSPPSTAPLAAALNSASNAGSLSLRMFTEEDPVQKARRKVFERLKTELNVIKGRESVVKLEQGGTIPAFFVHRLRECIVSAIEQRVRGYQKEIAKSLGNKKVPGWNLQTYVALQESLAFVYWESGYKEGSLKCYERVKDCIKEDFDNSKCRINPFRIASTSISSAHDVLNYASPEKRAMLSQCQLGELEMRSYIFSRQFAILYSMHMYEELPKLVFKFSYLSQLHLYTNEEEIEGVSNCLFIDAWVYSACSALKNNQFVPRNSSVDEAEETQEAEKCSLNFAKDFLARLICIQLLCLGNLLCSKYSEFPVQMPVIFGDVQSGFLESRRQWSANDKWLQEDINLSESLMSFENGCLEFVCLYSSLIELVRSMGRHRVAAELEGYCAVYMLATGRLEEAHQYFAQECSVIDKEQWNLILQLSLRSLARIEKQLNQLPKYLTCCLSILKILCERLRNGLFPSADILKSEALLWVEEMISVAKTVQENVDYSLESIFPNPKVIYEFDANEVLQFDPFTVDISLESYLPTNILIERCTMILMRTDVDENNCEDRVFLESIGSFELHPGANVFSVTTESVKYSGCMRIESVSLEIHRLKLIWRQSTGDFQSSDASNLLNAFFWVSKRPALGSISLESSSECYTKNSSFCLDEDILVQVCQHSSMEQAEVLLGFSSEDTEPKQTLSLPLIECDETHKLTVSVPIPIEVFDLSKVFCEKRCGRPYKQKAVMFGILKGTEQLSSGEYVPFEYRTEKEIVITFPFYIESDCQVLLSTDDYIKCIFSTMITNSLEQRIVCLPDIKLSIPEYLSICSDLQQFEQGITFDESSQRKLSFVEIVANSHSIQFTAVSKDDSLLNIVCAIPKNGKHTGSLEKVTLPCPFSFLDMLPSYIFRVEYTMDDHHLCQGSPTNLKVCLRICRWSEPGVFGDNLSYSIGGNCHEWMVQGKVSGNLPPNNGSIELSFTLVPIVTGMLYIPRICLAFMGQPVPEHNMYHHNHCQQVSICCPLSFLSPAPGNE
eukprot:jgi/Galph1/2501/GphlegSOOS_G1140.1